MCPSLSWLAAGSPMSTAKPYVRMWGQTLAWLSYQVLCQKHLQGGELQATLCWVMDDLQADSCSILAFPMQAFSNSPCIQCWHEPEHWYPRLLLHT